MECQRKSLIYRTGGWWNDNYRTETLEPLVKSSFAFAVAFDRNASRLAGMGRVISDGYPTGISRTCSYYLNTGCPASADA